jgi:hypothetical protein
VDVITITKRVYRLSLLRPSFRSFSTLPPRMFTRACQDHINSSHGKPPLASVQKPLDFGGNNKKKVLNVIPDVNKQAAVDRETQGVKVDRGNALIAALTKTDSFANRQVLIDGEVFDEADFDDIGFDEWDTPAIENTVQPVSRVDKNVIANTPMIEEDYFKDDELDEMDWNDSPPLDINKDNIQSVTGRSSPPGAVMPPNIPPAVLIESFSKEIIQNKENTSQPPADAPSVTDPESLGKLLFPSSQPFPWSTSPATEHTTTAAPPRPKRSLPWISNPSRYGTTDQQTSNFRKEKSQIKSIVRNGTTARGISTMSAEHSVDWDVLGITEKDVFERQKRERMEELQKKNEIARRGTEWIDQAPPPQTTAPAPRRRQKEKVAEKSNTKLFNKHKPLAKLFLSQEQLSVRKLVVEDKKSVFFTGSAGIGP